MESVVLTPRYIKYIRRGVGGYQMVDKDSGSSGDPVERGMEYGTTVGLYFNRTNPQSELDYIEIHHHYGFQLNRTVKLGLANWKPILRGREVYINDKLLNGLITCIVLIELIVYFSTAPPASPEENDVIMNLIFGPIRLDGIPIEYLIGQGQGQDRTELGLNIINLYSFFQYFENVYRLIDPFEKHVGSLWVIETMNFLRSIITEDGLDPGANPNEEIDVYLEMIAIHCSNLGLYRHFNRSPGPTRVSEEPTEPTEDTKIKEMKSLLENMKLIQNQIQSYHNQREELLINKLTDHVILKYSPNLDSSPNPNTEQIQELQRRVSMIETTLEKIYNIVSS